ncbi:zinc finger, CCHC-type containing protein [Tanacetum coccineum]
MSSFTVVNSSLWHACLGHVHYKKMLEMSKDDLIPAINENPEKCTTCMLTKITRKPFQSITRKYVILELIHSDLCDFRATPSLGNKKYVITFIDDAFRFCYVYLLHAKDEALDKFRIYKTEVELQENDLIKTLRTDRGGEYYDLVFFQYVGIIHETTSPYTPQQNGVAKRKNRALKEMVNFMAVVRLPDPKRKILDEKGIDCIFVVYAEHSKAYSIEEDPRTYNEAIQSCDAAFWKEEIDDEIGSIVENNTWIVISFGCYSQSGDPSNEWETAFLNGDLDEEVYMKQLEGFVMPGNKHKFDSSGKGVIICLYVDDMLIFGTDRNQVDETKKFLSSRFSMKDMGEADVILGTKDYGLSYVGYPSVLEGYLDASRINHVEDSSSTSGWVFLLGGCNDSSFRSTYILSLR